MEKEKNRAVAESDEEKEIGKEEGIPLEKTTGQELGRVYKVAI